MEASQLAYRAGAFCRDLTLSLIPMQNLISVNMSNHGRRNRGAMGARSPRILQ